MRACRACGAANLTDARFCGRCGAPLTAASAPERKLATVLFADVVGFTGLAERTDPEVVARLVDAAFRRMAEVVSEHGGTIDKFMGDSLMAVFGVPSAHEDDAERAVAAALAMRDLGGDLAFSIGVNSGEVMVTAVGRHGEVTVIGDTVNVAARLEKAAGAGEVLCGQLTAQLAGGRVAFRARAPVLVPGRSEPVAVFEALGLREPEGPGGAAPLVGRDEEVAFLLGRWRRARRAGRAEACLVIGEAGIGKTRLADELARRVAAEGGRVVRASYPGYGGLGGGRLAAEVIRRLGFTGDEQVDARVRSIAGELHPVVRVTDAAALRQEQVWAMRRLVADRAREAPLLVVLDDMHRAGPVTLELLAGLVGRPVDAGVLVVVAGRPEGEWLRHLAAVTTVRLGPLTDTDVVTLVGHLAGDTLAGDVVDVVRERAGGNPLYVRELVSAVAGGAGAVPVSLRALLAARLDALDPADKAVVQHLAVLGGQATADQLARVGSTDVGLALARLVAARVARAAPGDGPVALADPLLAEVAYDMLPHDRRAELHRRAADAADEPEHAARHLARAAAYAPDDTVLRAEAARSLGAAGLGLVAGSRPADAVRVLQHAVELGNHEPAVVLALARIHADEGRVSEAETALASLPADLTPEEAAERDHVVAMARIFSDPAEATERLRSVAQRWAELGVTHKQAWAHANAGVAWFNRSRMDEAAADLERALRLFAAAGDRAGTVATVSFYVLVRPEDPRVPAWLAEALAFGEETGDRHSQLSALVALAWNRYLCTRLGSEEECAEALGYARRLAELAAEMGVVDLGLHGRALAAHVARLTGCLAEAERLVGAARPEPVAEAGAAALDEAVAFAVACAREPRCAAPLPVAGDDPTAMAAFLIAVEALALAGRADEAAARLRDRPRPTIGVVGGGLEVVHGLVAVLAGAGPAALADIEQAGAVAERVGAGPARLAARALRAEVTGDLGGLPDDPPKGVAGALVLRARAVHGDRASADELARRSADLAVPGLAGIGRT